MIATFRNTLNDLFLNQSGHQTDSPLENGGWIYQRKDGSLFFRKIGKSQQWRRESGQINLDNPPTIKGARVVGVAHTHPYSRANQESFNKKMAPNVTGPSGWNGERGDVTTANSTQMPDLVVYENKPLGNLPAGEISVQIWGVGPERIPDKNCK
ncbi:MAG: hypothetical protein IPK58_11700 [Acidobacteria bacterium]|nr:hypothetical protein [Acidobacteriota bacterium]